MYPDGVWYYNVTTEDAARIVEEHLVNGQPVEELVMLKNRSLIPSSPSQPAFSLILLVPPLPGLGLFAVVRSSSF
ncbi:ferredoxin [Paenibacillus rhizoplanae]